VRITASWALANVCDSLRHCIDEFPLKKYTGALAGYQSGILNLLCCRIHIGIDFN
jgi:hypothetical protein